MGLWHLQIITMGRPKSTDKQITLTAIKGVKNRKSSQACLHATLQCEREGTLLKKCPRLTWPTQGHHNSNFRARSICGAQWSETDTVRYGWRPTSLLIIDHTLSLLCSGLHSLSSYVDPLSTSAILLSSGKISGLSRKGSGPRKWVAGLAAQSA